MKLAIFFTHTCMQAQEESEEESEEPLGEELQALKVELLKLQCLEEEVVVACSDTFDIKSWIASLSLSAQDTINFVSMKLEKRQKKGEVGLKVFNFFKGKRKEIQLLQSLSSYMLGERRCRSIDSLLARHHVPGQTPAGPLPEDQGPGIAHSPQGRALQGLHGFILITMLHHSCSVSVLQASQPQHERQQQQQREEDQDHQVHTVHLQIHCLLFVFGAGKQSLTTMLQLGRGIGRSFATGPAIQPSSQ
eukprot:6458476-Amphidinium_carterae.2